MRVQGTGPIENSEATKKASRSVSSVRQLPRKRRLSLGPRTWLAAGRGRAGLSRRLSASAGSVRW